MCCLVRSSVIFIYYENKIPAILLNCFLLLPVKGSGYLGLHKKESMEQCYRHNFRNVIKRNHVSGVYQDTITGWSRD